MAYIINKGVHSRRKVQEGKMCTFCGCYFTLTESDKIITGSVARGTQFLLQYVQCPNPTCRQSVVVGQIDLRYTTYEKKTE